MIRTTICTPNLRHKLAAAIHTLATMPAMLAATLALPLALTTSCTSEDPASPATPTPGQQVTITASLGGGDHATPDTRMGYEPNTDTAVGGLLTTWAEGDAFNIVPFDGGTAQTFTLTAGAGSSTGTFKGTVPDNDGGKGYTIFHPSTITSESQVLDFAYTGQTQKGNDNLTHLTAYHSMEVSTYDYTTIDFGNAMNQSSCMKFVLTLPEGIAITPTMITLASEDGSKCFYSTNSTSNASKASSLSLNLENVSIEAGGTITAYMMMSRQDVTLPATGIIVTVDATDGSTYTQTIVPASDKLSLAGGKMHTITASLEKPKSAASMTFTVKVGGSNGLDFIIPFISYSITPAEMTVDWGDGTPPVKIPTGTAGNAAVFNHTYKADGKYTITITSAQVDATQQQMPDFHFNNNNYDNPYALKLISMDSPLLNTGKPSLEYNFYGCTALTTIPADFFKNNTTVTSFKHCFRKTALTEIPEGLFDNNELAENFEYCFESTALTKIPEDLFKKNTKATTFNSCFKYTAITKIPAGLFDNNTAAENFRSCFENTALIEIPAGLFDNNKLVTNFHSCFSGCTELTEIPEGLFKNNTLVKTFSYCFNSCTTLAKIPASLFDNNTAALEFMNSFYGCTALTEIPAGLFDNNTAATNFMECFASCSKLILNANIFSTAAAQDNARFKNKNMNFKSCFYNVGGSIADDKISSSIAPELWKYDRGTGNWATTSCFEKNTFYNDNNGEFGNSADIPTDWGGTK